MKKCSLDNIVTKQSVNQFSRGFKMVGRVVIFTKENGHSVDDEPKNGNSAQKW